MPPKKRLPSGRRAPAVYVKEVRRIMRKNKRKINAHARWLRDRSGSGFWKNARSYHTITTHWKKAGVDIDSLLANVARQHGNKLRIWEDGPGKGCFGFELKERLKRKGINAHITATTLDSYEIHPYVKPSFDDVHEMKSELFIPPKPFHFIFTTAASINYVHYSLRKHHLLKMAYSLARGGHLLVAFYHLPLGNRGENKGAITGSLLQNRDAPTTRVEPEKQAITRAFAKRGFTAQFYSVGDAIGLHVIREPPRTIISPIK